MAHHIRRFAFILFVLALNSTASALENDEVFLFSYFDSNGENGVYLAMSEDGRTFTDLNGGNVVFTPPAWSDGDVLTRDPSIVYHDGTFNMVWTSDWWGNNFGTASSTDLLNWSTPVQVFPYAGYAAQDQPWNVWAPELHYDPTSGDHFVVWSSTTDAEFNNGDGSEDGHGNDHVLYYSRTSDFQTFTPAEVFFDQGWSVIDGSAAYDDRGTTDTSDDRWVMVVKNERLVTDPDPSGKNLRLTYLDSTIDWNTFDYSDWSAAEDPIIGQGTAIQPVDAEGPILVKNGDEWLIYWDIYTANDYGLASSTDLQNWTDETNNFQLFDSFGNEIVHPRHGTVFVAPRSAISFDIMSYARSDLNGDEDITLDDWIIFTSYHLADLSGLSDPSLFGDLDGDGDNDYLDFRLFQLDYDAYNGSGSFQAMLATVPEPMSALSFTAVGLTLTCLPRSRRAG